MSDVSKQSVIRTYGRYAPFYDMLFGAVQRPGILRMAEAVRTLCSSHILEIGVGTGLALMHYPKTARITGIDLSEDMLQKARERASRLPERNIQLMLMDAEQLQFPDDSFDCVTIPYVLSVTPNPDRLVDEVRRVCRPGGHVVIVNHFGGSRFWWLAERLVRSAASRIGFHSDFDYSRHILKHDWTVLSSKPVNFLGLYRIVVARNE